MITGDLVRLEIRPTRRTRIILEKFKPGALLAQLAPPGFSFFYRVTLNGEIKSCTEDAMEARESFRDCCRWSVTA